MEKFGGVTLLLGVVLLIASFIGYSSSNKYSETSKIIKVEKVDDVNYGFYNVKGKELKLKISDKSYEKFIKTNSATSIIKFSGLTYHEQTGEFYDSNDNGISNNSTAINIFFFLSLALIILGLICSGAIMQLDLLALLFLLD